METQLHVRQLRKRSKEHQVLAPNAAKIRLDEDKPSRLIPFPAAKATPAQVRMGTLVEMQEEERRRIAAELHDDLGQRLALIEIQIDQLQRACASIGLTTGIVGGLQKVREQIGEMDGDVHRICYRLHPVVLEKLGLFVALESFCREFSQRSGIRTKFEYRDLPKRIDRGPALCVYRLVQEALNNVSKHARTREVKVALKKTADAIEVVVEDSGCGFDTARSSIRGLGLMSMEERVRRTGGDCTIRSRIGIGTKVTAVIPMHPEVLDCPTGNGRAGD
jgi:signal transduction histidine kinase